MYWEEEIETMPREQLRILQEKRLKVQLEYVYQNSSFYRRKFEGVGFQPGDFKNLDDLVWCLINNWIYSIEHENVNSAVHPSTSSGRTAI